MGILSPWMLLGLLTVPAIIVLYLLRLKRQPKRVSSTLLWRQVIDDHQANAPFQKLRRNLLMLVQLLIAAVLVAAAIRPYKLVPGLGSKVGIVVLDASASMQATDVKPNRFEAGRAAIRKMIDGMGSGDRMALVSMSNRARTVCSLTSNKQALRVALAQMRCEDTHGSLKDAAAVAGALSAGEEATAFFVTDAASAEVENVPLGKLEPVLVKIGERSENVGLTALASRPSLERHKRPLLYAQLHNADSKLRAVTLELYDGERLLDAREVRVPGGESKPLIIGDLPVRAGLLRAHLRETDDLAVDNDAYVFLGSGRPLRVLVVTEGNLFLEQAITVDPRVSAARVAPDDFAAELEFDVCVLDNCAPASLPSGNYLFIGRPAGERSPLRVGRSVEGLTVASADRDHPVNQFVDWARVNFAEARPGRLASGATALVESRGGVLVAAREHGGRRSLALGFELTDTDFPLRADFPIFVANALNWLSQGRQATEGETRVLTTGEVVQVQGTVSLQSPDGVRQALPRATETGVLCPTRIGLYRVSHEGAAATLAVNLLDRAETDLRPSDRLSFRHQEVKEQLEPTLVKNELAPWFLLAALVVMLGEWWLYHRRP